MNFKIRFVQTYSINLIFENREEFFLMQEYLLKKASDASFSTAKAKSQIFQESQNPLYSFSFVEQNQNSKFKIPKVNNQEAKSIFVELNKKNPSKHSSSKKNWKFEQSCLLVYLIEKFSTLRKISNLTELDSSIWDDISDYLPGRSSNDCKYKILSLTASTITNIPWSSEERNALTEIIEEEGMNWNLVSQRLYERSNKKIFRTSKQCREHYMCFLKPNLKKGTWTEQEDYRLVCLFLQYGRKWSKIMKFIEGRNQNSIKNRFFLLFENKGRTSNHSDLIRKVKRKKQRMEKNLKNITLSFKQTMEQEIEEELENSKTWQKCSEVQMEKMENQPETRKGNQTQLSDYFVKQQQKADRQRKELNELELSRNRLSLNNCNSYQHLDFPHLQMGHKQISIEAFESFQQYICF